MRPFVRVRPQLPYLGVRARVVRPFDHVGMRNLVPVVLGGEPVWASLVEGVMRRSGILVPLLGVVHADIPAVTELRMAWLVPEGPGVPWARCCGMQTWLSDLGLGADRAAAPVGGSGGGPERRPGSVAGS